MLPFRLVCVGLWSRGKCVLIRVVSRRFFPHSKISLSYLLVSPSALAPLSGRVRLLSRRVTYTLQQLYVWLGLLVMEASFYICLATAGLTMAGREILPLIEISYRRNHRAIADGFAVARLRVGQGDSCVGFLELRLLRW